MRLLSNSRRLDVLTYGLIACAFLAGFAGAFMMRAHDTVTVRVRHVARSWGTPDQSVPGAQVNPALAGLTCDVYGGRKTVVCHP